MGQTQNLVLEKVRLVALREEAESNGQVEHALAYARTIQRMTEHMDNPDMVHIPFDFDDNEEDVPAVKKSVDVWAKLNERNRRKNVEEANRAEALTRQARMDNSQQ